MSLRRLRHWAALATTPCVALAIALPAASAGAAATSGHAAKASAAASLPKGRGGDETVVVVLRDQNKSVPSLGARRDRLARAEQRPIISELRRAGAKHIKSETLLNAVIADIAGNQVAALKANPAVSQVLRDATVPGAAPTVVPLGSVKGASGLRAHDLSNSCPTANSQSDPETDPEALSNINALGVVDGTDGGIDGAGVTVAYMAEGIDTTNPDFQRNAAFASAGSPAGSPVIDEVDFSGDGTAAATSGGEAFLDASSIAAQGNVTYDLNADYLSAASQTSPDCYIRIYGAAPGADVMGLKVFSAENSSTSTGFIEAIQYAVASGVKVLNESFGSNNFPDTSQDLIKEADDAAVAAGVTVVVSSGDAGNTSTIGSPSTDPSVISVGATTTFRSYAQANYGGFGTPGVGDGQYIDDNLSDLSSGGYAQDGKTVDMVAPGDLNWDVCTASPDFADCTNEADSGRSDMGLEGGTSEAAPLTAAAAADVIQAYSQTHDGTDPSPALVKQILMSTATDIEAPAQEQGAGLLNVGAAIQEAESISGTTSPGTGGLLVSPNQIDVSQAPGASTPETVSVTNTGQNTETVDLSTRALSASPAATPDSGSFCMQPGTATVDCPANTGVMPIWSGVDEVYQTETFTVPPTSDPSRLEFNADYQYTGQGSLLHVALFDPSGAYAGYSLPQGLADYSEVEVTDPVPGTWTAVFFTEQDGATGPSSTGTSGTVQWSAATYEYQAGDSISPPTLTIPAGGTATANLSVTSPSNPGDSSESIVVSDADNTTTIPVAISTTVPISGGEGDFEGVLGGGNGRGGAPAQTDTYSFTVPSGLSSLSSIIELENLNVGGIGVFDEVIANLIDPNGQIVASDTNSYSDDGGNFEISPYTWDDVADPLPGQWQLVVDYENPVAGTELSNPFFGAIVFDNSSASSTMPTSTSTTLEQGGSYSYQVSVTNNGANPEWYFADARSDSSTTYPLADINGSPTGMTLPGTSEPLYLVPPETTEVEAALSGTAPVSFDTGYCSGDPDVSPAVAGAGATGSQSGDSASLTYSEPEVPQGCWYMDPAEVGPFGAAGGTPATADASFDVVTQAFDQAVSSSTGDMWSYYNGIGSGTSFTPLYLTPGQSGTITVTVTPTGNPGTVESGTLYVDDTSTSSVNFPYATDGDVVSALPYSYTVGSSSPTPPPTVPVTLDQGGPTSATVSYGKGYSGSLSVTNATGAVSYSETSSADSSDVVVGPSGAISAAASLAPGSYTVGGNDADANGDTGTWSFSLTVTQATQTVILSAPSSGLVGGTGKVSASATSKLPVSLSASGPCSLSDNTVRYTAPGRCTITANQAGDADYAAARPVSATIRVQKANSHTAISLSPGSVTYGNEQVEQISVSVSPGTAGGVVRVSTGGREICTVRLSSGHASCSLSSRELEPGSYAVSAAYGGDADLAGSSASAPLMVKKAPGRHHS